LEGSRWRANTQDYFVSSELGLYVTQPRESKLTPSTCALAAVAPAVLFKAFDILDMPTFFFASDFSSRTSDEVHARLIEFFLAISDSLPFCENRASSTPILFSNTPDHHGTDTFMSTLRSGLANGVRESISAAVQHVREIFATELPTGTTADSIRAFCALKQRLQDEQT
jgi:hypothetical protein